jgi:hypothetical protein
MKTPDIVIDNRKSRLADFCIVTVPLAIVYWLSAPSGLPEADAGEFAAIGMCGGIAHPPGYPLLSMLLQLFAHLSPRLGLIHALVLLPILCNCCAAYFLMLALRCFFGSKDFSRTATLVIFLSVNVWRAGTIWEPFALNLLLASVVLFASVRLCTGTVSRRAHAWFFFCIGACFGLGVCNHHSLALLLPLPCAALIHNRTTLKTGIFTALAGFLLGLLPLSYFFFPQPLHSPVWGDWGEPWKRLFIHILRSEYGTTSLVTQTFGHWYYGPLLFVKNLPETLSIVFCVFACIGIWHGARNSILHKKFDQRYHPVSVAGMGLSFIAAGILFPSLFRFANNDPLCNMIASRFFSLPVLFLAFPLKKGLEVVWNRTGNTKAGMILVVIFLMFHAAYQWPDSSRKNDTLFDDHVRNVFSIVESNAVLIGTTDQDFSLGFYGRYVLGYKDAVYIQTGISNLPWSRKNLMHLVGDSLCRRSTVHCMIDNLRGNRSIYVLSLSSSDPDLQGLLKSSYPVGPLIRLVRDDRPVPTPVDVFRLNDIFLSTKMQWPPVSKLLFVNPWNISICAYYARTWQSIGDALQKQKQNDLAETAFKKRDFFLGK